MYKEYFADLHIHIGAGEDGRPVKITASRHLNFASILKEASENKGLDIVGIIDCASPVVLNDIEKLLLTGRMKELENGGIRYGDLLVIPGAEVESREDNGGQAHYLAYFPYIDNVREYSKIMSQYISNINLSSQSTGLNGKEIMKIIETTGGIMVPAHVFTPHKSFYGRSFTTYREIFNDDEWDRIPAIELGLSADTDLADYLSELSNKSFLSNSDAHSIGKIAREYNKIKLKKANFEEFKKALYRENGRGITGNFGLDPRLGKYHRSFCENCHKTFDRKEAVISCPLCDEENIVIGVKDRILNITERKEKISPNYRPGYIHQVPLADIPGIGARTLEKLLDAFGTEMNILHNVSCDKLRKIIGKGLAQAVDRARTGSVVIKPGGGGVYGKVIC